MLEIVLACVAMACRDLLGCVLTVAEARGRIWLAGAADALGDLASIAVTVVGAGQVILHGLTLYSIELLAALTLTSLFGTALWTRLSQRIEPVQPPSGVR